ncbi:MAG: DNA polymerase/3'-5' exonuclease PolX [Syntrophales bacterium]|nr:DNA polymerase/3'-5' exonuclease PolX [Syntrophales bacterium]
MQKEEVVRILNEIAVLLELAGENPFKSRAYEVAARNLERITEDIETLIEKDELSNISGIGEAIGKKIKQLVTTGRLEYYDQLKKSIPPGHLEMLKIPGLGPKKIRTLYQELGIKTVGELEYACRENRLVNLKGFGKKTQENVLKGIERIKQYQARRLYSEAYADAVHISTLLSDRLALPVTIAGSLRRGAETVKDIDLLVASYHPRDIADTFVHLDPVETVTSRGDTKVSVILKSGINSDLRIITPEEFPYALHHFTGSREHNTAMRSRAKDLGFKMNEYGLYRGEENIPCRSEEEIFHHLGLQYIPPELRENMGEIEVAEKGNLPILIEEQDLKGILHIHTTFSDGSLSLEEVAKIARQKGYTYIGISDHSQSAYYAGGLKKDDIIKQMLLIDELNKNLAPFRIFKGIEADILPDGSLDYEEEILSLFDFVIAAVHSHFQMKESEMTERICRALRNPYTTILAHPTGRLLLSREPYEVNMQMIITEAAKQGKVIELNANPYRLDISWPHLLVAKKMGVKIAINPDIHDMSGFGHLSLGIKIARKGWMEKRDCLNCLDTNEISRYFAKLRSSN